LAGGLPEASALSSYSGAAEIVCLIKPGESWSALSGIAGVRLVTGDVTDPPSLAAFLERGRDAVLIHCAGLIHPRWSARDFARVNAAGTQNVVDTAVRRGVRRLVHVSSNSPIGCNSAPDQLFDEDSPYNPYMGYGRSKQKAEDVVNAAHRAGAIETAIIRPPWFYGPNQPPRQTLFFRMIREGRFPIVGSGENRRSMAYVDNICQGLLLCALKPEANGRTYWIADRQPYSMNEIVSTVRSVLRDDFGLSVRERQPRLPGIVADAAWLADSVLQAGGLYVQKIHVLSEMNKTIACSSARARRELGYEPTIDLREGMKRSVEWLLSSGIRI
jgi:nucleoside-diphosphate-sugar epimerase